MIHRLLLKVERSEQEDCAFCHFRWHDFLTDCEERWPPKFQINRTWKKGIFPWNNVVKLCAALCILSRQDKVTIKLSSELEISIFNVYSNLLHNQLFSDNARRKRHYFITFYLVNNEEEEECQRIESKNQCST